MTKYPKLTNQKNSTHLLPSTSSRTKSAPHSGVPDSPVVSLPRAATCTQTRQPHVSFGFLWSRFPIFFSFEIWGVSFLRVMCMMFVVCMQGARICILCCSVFCESGCCSVSLDCCGRPTFWHCGSPKNAAAIGQNVSGSRGRMCWEGCWSAPVGLLGGLVFGGCNHVRLCIEWARSLEIWFKLWLVVISIKLH